MSNNISIRMSSGTTQSNGNASFNGSQSILTLPLSNGLSLSNEDEIAISNLSIAYSFYSISAAQNNNTFQYVNGSGITRTVLFPDGIYEYSDINSFLELVMTTNLDYILDDQQNPIFFINIAANPTISKLTFTFTKIYSVLPTGYSQPSGSTMTLSGQTMQLIIPSSNIRYTLGLNAQTLPSSPGVSDFFANSDFIPCISPNTSIQILCNLVNSLHSNPSTSLFDFVPQGNIGSLLFLEPKNLLWCKCASGTFGSISLIFCNQSGVMINVIDQNAITANLVIRRKLT